MIAFELSPTHAQRQTVNVGDAMQQFPAFIDMYHQLYEMIEDGQVPGASPEQLATWRINFRSGVVNYGGRPVEIDFFRQLMGGMPTESESTSIAIRYNSTIDFNVYAQNDATGTYGAVTGATFNGNINTTYTGPYAEFTIALQTYANNGASSNINVGDFLYIPNDAELIQVIKVDTSIAYAHVVYVAPYDPAYTINIYAQQPITPGHVSLSFGNSDFFTNPPQSNWETLGYTKIINPIYFTTNWETPRDLERPYRDVLQFPIIFDQVTGAEMDSWDFKAAADARERMIMSENVYFWAGQQMINPALKVNAVTNKYFGFDGFTTSMFYGGGNIQTYTPTYGWDLDVDYNQIRYKNDALKLSKEMLMINSLKFNDGMQRRSQDMFKNNSGSCTFDTFKRMGGDMADITRLGVDSYKWGSTSIHTKIADSFSDSRFMGVGYFPNAAFILPGDGQTDSNGRPVPPVEYFIPKGRRLSGMWSEYWVDGKKNINMLDVFQGEIEHQIMMAVHAVENMWAIMPNTID